MKFESWFQELTGQQPYPYQALLATRPELPDLLSVPTGAGKTAAVVLGWLWRRRFAAEPSRVKTPRRLVFCLPMRSLVEQTIRSAEGWLAAANLDQSVAVHQLLGGAVDKDWELAPADDAILVGTQDMLLSRALGRGYAMSRFRWPWHFGLLNSDCLWVMDEVQLMGPGRQARSAGTSRRTTGSTMTWISRLSRGHVQMRRSPRRRARTMWGASAISLVASYVTPDDAVGWFKHCNVIKAQPA